MYNLRYHIASLVAVFLALALGLILGGLVVSRGTVQRQQTALVEGLRREFSDLRAENRALAAENERLLAFSGMMSEMYVADRVRGRTALVIGGPQDDAAVGAVREAVEAGGGAVVIAELAAEGLGLGDEAVLARVRPLIGQEANALEALAATLTAEWATVGPRPVTETLVGAGVLELTGLKPTTTVDALVDVAHAGQREDAAGLALASAFTRYGPAIVAEQPTAGGALVRAVTDDGVAAIDTLGTPIGSYSLIALIEGAKPGRYGTGPGSLASFPRPPAP